MEPQITDHHDNYLSTLLDSFIQKGCAIRVDETRKLLITPRRLLSAYELVIIGSNRDALIELVQRRQVQDNAQHPGEVPASTSEEERTTQDQVGQPESPDRGIIAGAVIRLGVVSKQLEIFNESLDKIGDAIALREHRQGIEQTLAALDALGLTRSIVNDFREELIIITGPGTDNG